MHNTRPAPARPAARATRAVVVPGGRLRWLAVGAIAGVWLLASFAPPAAIAQPNANANGSGEDELIPPSSSGGMVDDPIARNHFLRGVQSLNDAYDAHVANVKEAEQASLGKAVRALQKLIADPEFRDDVIYRPELGRFMGGRQSAREALLNAGKGATERERPEAFRQAVLEAYRAEYNVSAADAMEQARINHNVELLEAVLLKYPFTTGAVTAGIQAARVAWEHGAVLHAASLCRRLLERQDIQETDAATLTAIAAACYAQAALVYEAGEMHKLAESRFESAAVQIGDMRRDLIGYTREQLELAAARARLPEFAAPWTGFGGDFTGNKIAPGEIDPAAQKWDEQLIHPLSTGSQNSFRLSYPSFNVPRNFPVVATGMAYVPNRNSVRAYNLFTSQLMWQFQVPIYSGMQYWMGEIDPSVIFTATVEGDDLFVPLEMPMVNQLHDPNGTNNHRNSLLGTYVVIHTPRRQLYRFDRRTGEVKWQIGAQWETTPDVSVIDSLSYGTAPVVVGDTVYVAGSKVFNENAHVYAVAFARDELASDAEGRKTPKVRWMTKLVSGLQETNLFGRPTREPFPSAMTYQSHRLFVCSNIGLMSCLDTLTGEELWAVMYDRLPFVPPVRLYPSWRDLTWMNNPPIVAEGNVLVAPMDSRKLYCYDAATGELRWSVNQVRARDEARIVAGVRDGRVYLIGDQRIYQLSLQDGEEIGNPIQMPGLGYGSQIGGRPAIVGNKMYVPTTNGIAIVNLDAFRLEVTTREGLGNSPGNLAVGDGAMVMYTESSRSRYGGSGRVMVAYDWNEMIAELKRQERLEPDNIAIKLRIANLSRQRGPATYADALTYFQKVVDMTAQVHSLEAELANREAHRGLFGLWMDEMGRARDLRDTRRVRLALEQAKAHVIEPRDGVQVLLVELDFVRQNEPARTVAVLAELLEKYPTLTYEFTPNQVMPVALFAHLEIAALAEAERRFAVAVEHWQTMMERFGDFRHENRPIRERAIDAIRRIVGVAGRGAYAEVERRANAQFQDALRVRDEVGLVSVADRYPNSEAAPNALISLARLILARTDVPAPAERDLDRVTDVLRRLLREHPTSTFKAESYALLAEVYEKREMWHAAQSVYRQLQREFGGQRVTVRGREMLVDEFVVEALKKPEFQNLKEVTPTSELADMPLQLLSETALGEMANARLLSAAGTPPPGLGNHYFVWSRRQLECRDSVTGDLLWGNADPMVVYELAFVSGRLVVVGTSAVFGFDPLTGEQIWRRDLSLQVQDATIKDGVAAVLLRDRRQSDMQYEFSLTVINAEDGSVIGTSATKYNELIVSKPIVQAGTIVIHSTVPGKVIGFRADDPRMPTFELQFQSRLASAPVVVDDERFAVVTLDSTIYIYRLSNGMMLQRITTEAPVLADRIFVTPNGQSLIYCDQNRRVVAVDPGTGATIWKHTFDPRDVVLHRSTLIQGAMVVLRRVTVNATVQIQATALDAGTGEPLWKSSLMDNQQFDCQNVFDTSRYIVFAMRRIYRDTDATTGRERVRTELQIIIIDRQSGETLQRIKPSLGDTLIPQILIKDRALFVTGDDRVLKYGR